MKVRGLFVKIFLWFWLAMALVNLGLSVSFFRAERNRFNPPWRDTHAAVLGVYAQTAAETFARDGADALARYLQRVEAVSRVRAVLFDEQGIEVSGRTPPARARQLALAAAANDAPQFFVSAPPRPPPAINVELGAQAVTVASGRRYTLVAELPTPVPPPFRSLNGPDFRQLVLRHLIGLCVGGVFCYWLARRLTAPIIKLQAATLELASGNLAARVGAELTAQRDELGHLGRDFNLMAERIESLMAAQRRLLGDISHELRSPLTRLGVALELARRRANAESHAALDRIGREAVSLNEMIGQLLTLARTENFADESNRVVIDLHALVREVADDADYEARSRGCAVRVTHADPCTLLGVHALLRSAIENVVRNAVRHTTVNTEVEVALVCRQGNADDRHAVISVRDHGAGVPEAALETIFQPFYRVEEARDRQTGGTGLGLAIAARALRLHGGTVTAANAPGGGLQVELKLPLNEHP